MRHMVDIFVKFSRDERGATSIEYAFIAMLVSVATIGAIRQVGVSVSDLMGRIIPGLQ